MLMARKEKTVKVEITFTEGYEKRFTEAILKIFKKRELQKEKVEKAAG